ncbi:MAG: thrombospondin type 3 repeat-containing protein, partial [Planctomycetes bacterium]|nr:thrombospondin type 3 repeat-containing protein [Planctomycetota bacterium]
MHNKAFARLCLFSLLIGFTGVGVGLTGCVMDPDGTDPPPEQPLDRDDDGVADDDDQCLDTPDGAAVNDDGCADSQLDSDGDGVSDEADLCADTPPETDVDETGCDLGGRPVPGDRPVPDTDADGVPDGSDNCPNTPADATVDTDGCAANQRDTDGDGVTDNIDQCANTPAGSEVDDFGCRPDQQPAPDEDNDGVPDDVDACLETPAGAIVDADGCEIQVDTDNDGVTDDVDLCPNTAAGTLVDSTGCRISSGGGGGGGGGGTTPTCGDGNVDDGEECDGGGESVTCDADCTAVQCGDGTVNVAAGEQCEPPGIACCDENCKNASGGTFSADNCSEATALCDDEGTFAFDNTSATQDGPPHTRCIEFGEDQIDNDVWACWTAPCTGTVFVSTCDLTAVDTKIAVYDGCTCPVTDAGLLSCNDDLCDVQSITSFEAAAGQSYLIRMGTFLDEVGGTGAVSIRCGLSECPAAGDCSTGHDTPGCDDEDCCETVCAVDPICCDAAEGAWDDICADEAVGFCTGSFAACAADAGSCTDPDGNGTPGCQDVECCNAVCLDDPFCCVDVWD